MKRTQFFLQQRTSGFTLVEMSVVLMIIILLVSGMLVGQRMVENTRYQETVEMIEDYRAALMAFQSRYEYLPGDFPNATTAFDLPTGVSTYNGNGDAIISADSNGVMGDQTADEGANALQHLILAGLISGDPGASDQSRILPIGGTIRQLQHFYASNGIFVGLELTNVPRKYIMRLERDMDDGYGKTGIILDYNKNDYPTDVNSAGYIFIKL